MSVVHKKILPEYFAQILAGNKTFELRLADWNCNEGDILILDEIDQKTHLPTGRTLTKKVGYVLKTKDISLFPERDVKKYGYQIISLVEEAV